MITHKAYLLTALVLTGCVSHPSILDTKKEYVLTWSTEQLKQPVDDNHQLLSLVNKPALSAFVKQALNDNYDLQATAIRLKQASLLNYQSQIARRPTANATLNATRQKSGGTLSTEYGVALNVSWELDVWGRLADGHYATQLDQQIQQLDYQAAKNSLAARIAQLWLQINYRQQVIAVEKKWLASLVNTEEVILASYEAGLNQIADLDAAKAATARVRVSLDNRQFQQERAWRSLALLNAKPLTERDKHDLQLTATFPEISRTALTMPAEIVGSRPDLQAAYLKIRSADKKAAASYKELLPKFTLTASVSSNKPKLEQLLSGSPLWNLIGGITAPLFDRGRLKANAEIADLTTEIRYLEYQKTLQSAFNEIDNYMEQEASYLRQQIQLEQALAFSRSSQEYYQSRYQDGLSTILELLLAKRQAFQSHIELLQLQQQRLSNRIQLGLSLGMGV